MVITAQGIITAGAVIAAIVAIVKYYNKVYDIVKNQKKQDSDIDNIKEELALLTFGVLACLKGLKEQGCDGAVTDAIDKINKHLNQAAHGI